MDPNNTGSTARQVLSQAIADSGRAEAIRSLVRREVGPKALGFVETQVDLRSPQLTIHKTAQTFEIDKLPRGIYSALVNLERLNDVRRINKFLEVVNGKLPVGGVFIGCLETANLRRDRLLAKYPPVIAQIYFAFDWIFKRVFPKLPVFKTLYFWITSGRNRVLTFTEAFGRLYCCGFKVAAFETDEHLLYFAAVKQEEPSYDVNPSYGPFFGMKRVGMHGKEIVVYKIRTMHAYSEYLQDYVYELNQLDVGGKFRNDFRLMPVARFLRRVWIDEIPMLWNVIHGELKLVGVRPISAQYLGLYAPDVRNRRMRYKPGLIPPFYVDLPKNLDEIMASEMAYFDAYDRRPILTDVKYFSLALRNILFRGARSH